MIFLSLNPPGASSRSYLVADRREAMIVDPVTDFVDAYDAELAKRHLRLVAVVDTHTHADHVSGAAELSRRTGAPLVMHHQAPRACVHRRVRDGDELVVGSLRVRVIATPGHTYDSISLLVGDRILTGDVLDVGPTGHSDESCSNGEAWEESVAALRKLEPTLSVFGTHVDPSKPRVLMAALAEAWESRSVLPAPGSGSRMGTDFRRPSDGASFDALRSNLACASVPRTPVAAVGGRAVPRMQPSDLVQALRSNDAPHVIDVRSVEEYFDASLGRVPGALLVPLEHLEAEGDALRSLGGGLVVSCRTTARAVLAASVLIDQGMTDVRVLEGGVLAWKAEGHPVELG